MPRNDPICVSNIIMQYESVLILSELVCVDV